MNLTDFSKVCTTLSKKFIGFKETQEKLSEEFTPVMAEIGVNYFKEKVKTGGEGLPDKGGYGSHPVTESWKNIKQKYTGQSKDAIASGASLESLKILKKSPGKALIGLGVNEVVPHFGGGGYSKTGRTIPIGQYIYFVEVSAKTPRPLIIVAIATFSSRIFPAGQQILQKGIDKVLNKKFSQKAISEKIYKNTVKSDVTKIIKEIQTKVGKMK